MPQKSTTWKLAVACATLAATVVIGISATGNVQAKSDKDLFVIKTWTRKDCSVTPWTVADKLGFLAQEGLKFEYTGETQPALQIPSILRGNNDVGAFHPNTIAVAKAGGAKVTAVAQCGLEPTDPKVPEKLRHMFWYVNQQRHPEVKRFSDLKKIPGKIKIATITRNICADFETNLLADRYGVPRDKFEWVTMPDVQAIQALKQGLVDVSEVHPPFYKGMQDAGARKIADTSETGLGASAGLTYHIFRDEFIRQHPREVAAFTRALARAQRWANENPLKAQKLTEEAIGVPVTGNHYYSEVTRIDEKLAVPWIRDLENNHVIPKGKVTTANLVTHDIERINLQVIGERANKR